MASTVPLVVAIYDNPGIKHWSLFIDSEDKADKTIIHLLGSRQCYFCNVRTPSDARNSNSLIELCTVCRIDSIKIDAIKNIARNTRVRNEQSDYSCQDFILDLLDRLEEEDIIDANSGNYRRNKDAIKAKRESWQ